MSIAVKSGLPSLGSTEGAVITKDDISVTEETSPSASVGEDLPRGKSAYEVAVENGFSGTETEWLASLKGEPGAPGAPGKDGTDGKTPYVGDNGNWYIGADDTGKPSRGAKGDKGEKGDKGAKGDKGDTGAQGIQGERGIQGVQGAKGDKGDTGAKGEPGSPGAKGDKGDTGATPNLTIGSVTTLEAGQNATASMGGTAESPVLNLGIPRGAKGEPGEGGADAYYVKLDGDFPDYALSEATPLADIVAAYNDGKALFCRGYAGGYFTIELPLFSAFSSSSVFIFSGSHCVDNTGALPQNAMITITVEENGVYCEYNEYLTQSNIVTSVSASSTNSEVPSAKCLYDELQKCNLKQATANTLGGVKADSAEVADTQPVRIGGDGKLYTAPGVTDISTKMDANNPVGTGSFSMNRKAGTEIGVNSHAEGNNTTASGYISHAEGNNTTASGYGSHAEGYMTVASGNHSHVQGKRNIEDSSSIYADIIGNGTSDTARSNAATVDWNGNAWFAGDVYTGSNSGTNKDDGSKKLATKEYVDSLIAAGGTDISLGLTSASVGQIIKVKAIDGSGKPTEWETANMPSGGGSEWVKVADVTYNSNKEVVVESIDYESGVFTSTNHGLQNGDNVYFVPNSVYEYSPEKYMPGGTLSGTEYKVTNATENTFALSGVTMTANQDIDFTKWHLETNDNYGSSVFISNLKLMNDVKVISYGKTVSFNNFSTCAAEVNNVLSTAGAYEGKLPNNHFYDGFGHIGYEVFIGNIFGCCETVITRLDKTHIRSEITALSSESKKSASWGINSSISHAVAIAECLESFKHPTELKYWNFGPANGYRIEVYTK